MAPLPLLPAPQPVAAFSIAPSKPPGVDWEGVFRATGRFLAMEHAFRLLTEPGTRSGLAGSYFENYGRAITNLHGWADGDEFYVNFVGHPMQGSVAGFLWVRNDRAYRAAEFGRDRMYWKSRLRAAAFAWAYSEQFEVGPFSEASIGAIQALFPQQGFVDHVVTPSIGLGWMIGEDVVDRYLIQRIEGGTGNRIIRLLARASLNPSRTMANVLNHEAPWHRESRAGIRSYMPIDRSLLLKAPVGTSSTAAPRDTNGAAPFEASFTFQPEHLWGTGRVGCLGGGGNAAIRTSPAWQMVFEVSGCKMAGLGENLSGDSLTYMMGPRYRPVGKGRWSANVQLLVGGNKLTEERTDPLLKRAVEARTPRPPADAPSLHGKYTQCADSNGFAVASGAGVDYKLNAALTLRVAEFSYRHSWAGPLWGTSYSNAIRFTSGLVLRMGTW